MSEINQIKQIQFNMPTKDENGKPTVTTTQYTFTPSIDDIEYNGMPLPEIIENIKNGTVEVGKAKEADKLSTNAGDENTPIYFQNGKPVAIEGAKLTDTTYDAAGQGLGLVKSGGVATVENGVITNVSKATNADNAVRATQDNNGNNIANTYAQKFSTSLILDGKTSVAKNWQLGINRWTLEGVLETDTPEVGIIYSENDSTDEEYDYNLNKIRWLRVGNGYIEAYATSEITTSIPLWIKVVR